MKPAIYRRGGACPYPRFVNNRRGGACPRPRSFFMVAVDLRADLSALIDAVIEAGQPQGTSRAEAPPPPSNISQLIATAREYLRQDKAADVLIGRIGMIAAHGDTDGHPTITLDAASMLARLAYWMPAPT